MSASGFWNQLTDQKLQHYVDTKFANFFRILPHANIIVIAFIVDTGCSTITYPFLEHLESIHASARRLTIADGKSYRVKGVGMLSGMVTRTESNNTRGGGVLLSLPRVDVHERFPPLLGTACLPNVRFLCQGKFGCLWPNCDAAPNYKVVTPYVAELGGFVCPVWIPLNGNAKNSIQHVRLASCQHVRMVFTCDSHRVFPFLNKDGFNLSTANLPESVSVYCVAHLRCAHYVTPLLVHCEYVVAHPDSYLPAHVRWCTLIKQGHAAFKKAGYKCRICVQCKFSAKPIERPMKRSSDTSRTAAFLEELSGGRHLAFSDIVVSASHPAFDGSQYALITVLTPPLNGDEYVTRYIVHCMKTKSQTGQTIDGLAQHLHNGGILPRFWVVDGELQSKNTERCLEQLGSQLLSTAPSSPWQNRAERAIQTLVSGARCCLMDSALDIRYWPFALRHCADVLNTLNCRPNARNNMPGRLANDRFCRVDSGAQSSSNYLARFGAKAVVKTHDAKGKWDARGDEGVYLGRATTSMTGCICVVPTEGGNCSERRFNSFVVHSGHLFAPSPLREHSDGDVSWPDAGVYGGGSDSSWTPSTSSVPVGSGDRNGGEVRFPATGPREPLPTTPAMAEAAEDVPATGSREPPPTRPNVELSMLSPEFTMTEPQSENEDRENDDSDQPSRLSSNDKTSPEAMGPTPLPVGDSKAFDQNYNPATIWPDEATAEEPEPPSSTTRRYPIRSTRGIPPRIPGVTQLPAPSDLRPDQRGALRELSATAEMSPTKRPAPSDVTQLPAPSDPRPDQRGALRELSATAEMSPNKCVVLEQCASCDRFEPVDEGSLLDPDADEESESSEVQYTFRCQVCRAQEFNTALCVVHGDGFVMDASEATVNNVRAVRVGVAHYELQMPVDSQGCKPCVRLGHVNHAVYEETMAHADAFVRLTKVSWSKVLLHPRRAEFIAELEREVNVISDKCPLRLRSEAGNSKIVPSFLMAGVKECGRVKARILVLGQNEELPEARDRVQAMTTYAGSTPLELIRYQLSVAFLHNFVIVLFDISEAFLQSDQEVMKNENYQTIYVSPPKECGSIAKTHLWEVQGNLYGRKSAPRLWALSLKRFLIESGFKPLVAEESIYVAAFDATGSAVPDHNSLSVSVILLVYVDDCVLKFAVRPGDARLADPRENVVYKKYVDLFGKRFKIKEFVVIPPWSEVPKAVHTRFMGSELVVRHSVTNTTVEWSHKEKLTKIIQVAERSSLCGSLRACTSYPTTALPYTGQLPGPTVDPSSCLDKVQHSEYRSLSMSLLYTAVSCRPDLLPASIYLARWGSCPNKSHGRLLLHVLKYVKGTIDRVLTWTFPRSQAVQQWCVGAYADASWGGEVPDNSGKSVSGAVFVLRVVCGGSMYFVVWSWHSRTQKSIARSSTDSETVSGSAAAATLMGVRHVTQNILLAAPGSDANTLFPDDHALWLDSMAVQLIGCNAASTKSVKHVELSDLYMRQANAEGKLKVGGVCREDNAADFMARLRVAPAEFRKWTSFLLTGRIVYGC